MWRARAIARCASGIGMPSSFSAAELAAAGTRSAGAEAAASLWSSSSSASLRPRASGVGEGSCGLLRPCATLRAEPWEGVGSGSGWL
eukprot:9711142-Lingulodinium_polyedra.AAC.1